MPPAAPVNTPMKDVTSDAAIRPKNVSGPTSGVPRKSIGRRCEKMRSTGESKAAGASIADQGAHPPLHMRSVDTQPAGDRVHLHGPARPAAAKWSNTSAPDSSGPPPSALMARGCSRAARSSRTRDAAVACAEQAIRPARANGMSLRHVQRVATARDAPAPWRSSAGCATEIADEARPPRRPDVHPQVANSRPDRTTHAVCPALECQQIRRIR